MLVVVALLAEAVRPQPAMPAQHPRLVLRRRPGRRPAAPQGLLPAEAIEFVVAVLLLLSHQPLALVQLQLQPLLLRLLLLLLLPPQHCSIVLLLQCGASRVIALLPLQLRLLVARRHARLRRHHRSGHVHVDGTPVQGPSHRSEGAGG